MTIKVFLEQFNDAPYSDIELAEVASDVEGKVGKRARNFLEALRKFERGLEDIGYERG